MLSCIEHEKSFITFKQSLETKDIKSKECLYMSQNQKVILCRGSIAHKMSRVIRKPDFCICENKDADQLRGNPEANQRLLLSLHG